MSKAEKGKEKKKKQFTDKQLPGEGEPAGETWDQGSPPLRVSH